MADCSRIVFLDFNAGIGFDDPEMTRTSITAMRVKVELLRKQTNDFADALQAGYDWLEEAL